MRLALLEAMNAARRERRAGVLATRLDGGEQRFVLAEEAAADPLGEAIAAALRAGKSVAVKHDGADYFLTVVAPATRLALVGATHIAQAAAPIARVLGFATTVVDPRAAFATPERFPDAVALAEWPQDAFAAAPLDRHTAVCLLAHDPKIDDPALILALRSDCFYIGALGSKKTHATRLARMRAAGFDEAALARVHAPIGLDIGAASPAEIALSIVGEIVAALRGKASIRATGQGTAPAPQRGGDG